MTDTAFPAQNSETYFPAHANSPERLSPAEFLQETCPTCRGAAWSVNCNPCPTCKGAGRILRHTHSEPSAVDGDTAVDQEVSRLREQLEAMREPLHTYAVNDACAGLADPGEGLCSKPDRPCINCRAWGALRGGA